MWFTVNIRRSFLDQNKHDMTLTPANLHTEGQCSSVEADGPLKPRWVSVSVDLYRPVLHCVSDSKAKRKTMGYLQQVFICPYTHTRVAVALCLITSEGQWINEPQYKSPHYLR